jgi:hypothetical protein
VDCKFPVLLYFAEPGMLIGIKMLPAHKVKGKGAAKIASGA